MKSRDIVIDKNELTIRIGQHVNKYSSLHAFNTALMLIIWQKGKVSK